MAHIAVFTLPAQGHVTSSLAVVEELVRRGHQVTYLTTEEYAAVVKAVGAEPLVYPTTWVREAETGGEEQPEPAASEIVAWGPLIALGETLAQVPVAEERFEASPPDLVLYDAVSYLVGRGLAHAWGVPAVRMYTTFASRQDFSLFRKLTATVETDPEHLAVREFARLSGEFLSRCGHPEVPALELSERDEELTLVHLPRTFQLAPEKFGERYAFVGPGLGDRRAHGSWQPPESGLPVVLVSLGTEAPHPSAAFFRSCVEAFRDQPWHLVLSTGKVAPEELGPLPPNVEAHERVPQLDVLRHAAAFVTHGGMGGVMEALACGVPLVAVPKVPEQGVTAARVAELGLGLCVSADGVSAEGMPGVPTPVAEHVERLGLGVFRPFRGEADGWLREAVRRVTSDPETAVRIAAMGREIETAGGARAAADAVEARLLRGRVGGDA